MYYRFVWELDRTMVNLRTRLPPLLKFQRWELCCREVSDYVLSICVAACSSDGKSWNTSPTIIEVSAMGALLSGGFRLCIIDLCGSLIERW
ncbi:hypothetical protein [Candidatus Epulonipiscium viviparus]|uniref:hypothetical protein n=1 Tax=Candidatus Epulonipiscium viviparus TaxID=420336 RepID=UPI0027381164|nr:hypothetical protein [Candidatus Epulopiscium viviparus]